MNELRLRAVEAGDLPAIADIYAHYVNHSVATFDEHPMSVEAWRDRMVDLAALGLPFIVLATDTEITGYGFASPYRRAKTAYRRTVEDSVYLAPTWTGKGLGRELLGAVIAACEQTDARELIAVIADVGNDASVRLHEALGFVEVGTLRNVGYKFDRWIDTTLLQRHLGRTR